MQKSEVFLFFAFCMNKMKYIFLNLILVIILSFQRKYADSAVLTSDESAVLCGPGVKGCADQEVR